jgi:tripartite-type tricarboxylate transporter receptor subunit TctC
MVRLSLHLASTFVVLAALAGVAAAQEPATFYTGKTLTLYAGMPVGGGVDDEMRLVGRHLSKFIPGHPSIVPRNMPGAGAVVLGNYLRHTAVSDGLTLGMPTRSAFLLSNVVTQTGINYNLADFPMSAGPAATASRSGYASRPASPALLTCATPRKRS